MAIPENQLEIWANRGSQTKFKDAHESVRKALEAYNWPNGKPNYQIYLQGSYKNSTTTRSNSDVDVVVQLDSPHMADLNRLSLTEKNAYKRDLSYSTYTWDIFRSDVFNALNKKEGLTPSQGNKCIKVKTPYLDADVVVCMQYRLYERYQNSQNQTYIEGMTFKTQGGWVINYPKQHDENGTIKSKNTNGSYYSTIRIFKNMKSTLVNKGILTSKEAPSYFIECLLYNIPDVNFVSKYGETVFNVLTYLNSCRIENFKCQNGISNLFGNSPDQWSVSDANKFINKTVELWNKW